MTTEQTRTHDTYLFLHLMKTAGTSLNAHLADNFPPEAIYPQAADAWAGADWIRYGSMSSLLELTPEQRASIHVYRGHYPLLVADVVKPDWTLTLLREPVERIVSALRQKQRNDPRGAERSLEEIYETDPIRWNVIQDYQVRQFALTAEELVAAGEVIDAIFPGRDMPGAEVPHYVYVPLDDERLERAVANVATVDVIGLSSDFDAFLDELRRRFGWRFPNAHRRRVAPSAPPAPRPLLDRIATDSAYDVEFYRRVVEEILPRR